MPEIETLAKRVATVRSELQRMKPDLEAALPRGMSADVLTQVVLTSVVRNPKLLDCTPASFYAAIRQACQLGLMPDGVLGEAAIVPFKETATFMPMYQGLLKLCYQGEMVEAIDAHNVFEGDDFKYAYGLTPYLEHTPRTDHRTDPKKITHTYAIAWLKGGRPIFRVLTRPEIESYRSRSRAKDDGPWITDWAAMALKTALLRITRLIPKSSENLKVVLAIAQQQELGETGADVLPPMPEPLPDTGVQKPKVLDKVAQKLGNQQSERAKTDTPLAEQGTLPATPTPVANGSPGAGTGQPGPGTGVSVSSLIGEIQQLAKTKNVKLTDVNAFCQTRYTLDLLECQISELQGVKAKLSEHMSGAKFV